MDLLEKDKIMNDEIKSSLKYREIVDSEVSQQQYIKGYFTDVEIIDTNAKFLEVYRCVQFWNLKYPENMIQYASQPNYAPQSLVENMALTGKDSHFEFFKNLIDNAVYKESSENAEGNLDYSSLTVLNRADLVEKLFESGVPFSDIYSGPTYGNSTLEVVKRMLANDYTPSDDVVMWYISQGFGKIVEIMIPHCYDPEFIFSETPLDLDTYKVMLSVIYDNKEIIDEQAEVYLNRIVSDPQFDSMKIDVALFIELYRKCQSKMSAEYKKILLKMVAEKGQPFLTYSLLKEFDSEYKSNSDCVKINPISLTSFIMDIIQDSRTYIIFSVQILKRVNYDSIYELAQDIEPDEQIDSRYEISSIDCANIYGENFGDSSDDEFVSKEYQEYQARYNNQEFDEIREISLIDVVGNISLYKVIDPESRGGTERVEYRMKSWNSDDELEDD